MTSISKTTLDFLAALKSNNNRDWFAEHKTEFQKEQKKAKVFYNALMLKLKEHDEIESVKIFRIYRDVRFSPDKTPYKPHFAGNFVRATNIKRGGYYLRIRPGESFLAGGFWEPNKEDLFRIRKEFELDATEIREIITLYDAPSGEVKQTLLLLKKIAERRNTLNQQQKDIQTMLNELNQLEEKLNQ